MLKLFAFTFLIPTLGFATVDVEKILDKNLGKSSGKLEPQPQFQCDIEVQTSNLEDTKYIVMPGFAASVALMTYPSANWNIDLQKNLITYDFHESPEYKMNLEYNPNTLKFTKFYSTRNGITVTCTLANSETLK